MHCIEIYDKNFKPTNTIVKDTLPVTAIDESDAEISISDENRASWRKSSVMLNSGELRQSKYYVLTAAAHNEQSWFYYWMNSSSSCKINESKSYSCFDRALCYAGGSDSVTKKHLELRNKDAAKRIQHHTEKG